MATTIEEVAPCRKKLRLELKADRVAGTRAEVLKEFRKNARLPGFRPGHAPEPMVESRYAKEIEEELRRRLVPEAYREAVAELKLVVVGEPQIESVDYRPGQPMVAVAMVDTAPEFAVPEYRGILVKKREAVATEEELTAALESVRDQQADFVNVTGRGLQTGDFAVLTYSGVVEGKPIAQLVPDAKTLGENKDFWLLVAADSFLPGFCDQLLGAQPGEKRQVLIDFPADFAQQPLAGRKATYFVDVTAIKEKKLPVLDDEFAKKIGVDDLAKLREEVRKSLLAQHENEIKGEIRKQIIEYLLGQTKFDLPESLVAQETRGIIYDVVRENSMRGATKAQLEEKKDEIFGFAAQTARERLRSSFVLDAIARAEQIKVEPAEVNQRIAQLAQRYRVTPAKLKSQLEERGGLGEIEEQIRVGKTLDFLVASAKLEPVS